MDRKKDTHTVIDLFCGCGGLTLGFLHAGYNVLMGIDNDQASLITYKNNFKDIIALNTDLSAKSALNQVVDSIGSDELDVIIAGPPCQGFSLTGPRNFNDDRNKLYLAAIRFVGDLNPKSFLIENVPGIATLYKGRIRQEIIHRFQNLGYNVSFKILLAADYGVPQMRKRAFFVGLRDGLGYYQFPKPTHMPDNYITCFDAISDLPGRENELGAEEDEYESEPTTYYQKKMRNNCKKLYNHVATNHTEMVKNVISQVPEGGNYKDLPPGVGESRKFNEAWTRYDSKKPSRTIDTGHRNHFHYRYNRVPTIRENARFQSFPDTFRFYGSKTQQNKQVGNAVSSLLTFHLAKKLKGYLSGKQKNISPLLNSIGSNSISFGAIQKTFDFEGSDLN